jgi:hypothetical protein
MLPLLKVTPLKIDLIAGTVVEVSSIGITLDKSRVLTHSNAAISSDLNSISVVFSSG